MTQLTAEIKELEINKKFHPHIESVDVLTERKSNIDDEIKDYDSFMIRILSIMELFQVSSK